MRASQRGSLKKKKKSGFERVRKENGEKRKKSEFERMRKEKGEPGCHPSAFVQTPSLTRMINLIT